MFWRKMMSSTRQARNQHESGSKQSDTFSETSVDFLRLEGVMYQKMYVSISIAVRTSDPNYNNSV
jgi:hypothetical protein